MRVHPDSPSGSWLLDSSHKVFLGKDSTLHPQRQLDNEEINNQSHKGWFSDEYGTQSGQPGTSAGMMKKKYTVGIVKLRKYKPVSLWP